MIVRVVLPVVLIVAGLTANYFFNRSRTSRYDYKCGNCGNVFSLAAAVASFAPHRVGGLKWVRCPSCGSRTWVTPVPKA